MVATACMRLLRMERMCISFISLLLAPSPHSSFHAIKIHHNASSSSLSPVHICMPERTHIWGIPPIQDSIASNLTPPQTRRCALVSKEWYTIFMPYTWHHIQHHHWDSARDIGPQSLLTKGYQNHVKSMGLFLTLPQRIIGVNSPFTFPNLVRLQVEIGTLSGYDLLRLYDFVNSYPLLRVLVIKHICILSSEEDHQVDRLCALVRNHPGLQDLELQLYRPVSFSAIVKILQSVSRLAKLRAGIIANTLHPGFRMEDSPFQDMAVKSLDLSFTVEEVILRLLERCPSLERLRLVKDFVHGGQAVALLKVLQEHCPSLKELTLTSPTPNETNCAETIFKGLSNLKRIGLMIPPLWQRRCYLTDVLGPHERTLVHLDLLWGSPIPYQAFVALTASCPKLRELKAKVTLSGRPRDEDPPPVCLGIRELKLALWRHGSTRRGFSIKFQALFERVGMFVSLSDLIVDCVAHTKAHERNLMSALRSLAGLRRLNHFRYYQHNNVTLDEEQIELILGQWLSLEELYLSPFSRCLRWGVPFRVKLRAAYPALLYNGDLL